MNLKIVKVNFLILRPKEQAADLEKKLQEVDNKYFIEPIFKVEYCKIKLLNQPNSVILTSFNAIYPFLSAKISKNVEIFAISNKIALEMQKNGYKNIKIAENPNSASLQKLILAQKLSKNNKILYFCGNFIKTDFGQTLQNKGLNCSKIKAYNVIYKNEFSAKLLEYVKNNKFDYVLCYSKNVVENFAKLRKMHKLVDYFNNCKIMGFSDEIVAQIKENNFKKFDHFKSIKILQEFYNI